MLKLQKIYEFPQIPAELNCLIWEYIESEYRQRAHAIKDKVMQITAKDKGYMGVS